MQSMPMPVGGYAIAIDVGIMNLGICVFDFVTGQIVHWDRVSLCTGGRYMPSRNVEYVRDFLAKHDYYFQRCFVLLVERQIRCNMRIVEAILQTLFYERCIIVSARSIKVHFGISTKAYRTNKQKAVEWAKACMAANPQLFAPGVDMVFQDTSKRDDLADSLLICMYYLDTYSNQLTNTTGWCPPQLDGSV